MGVAEGRQIAFDKAQRLRALSWDELRAQPRKRTGGVRGPSGRRYTMEIGFDHSEADVEEPEFPIDPIEDPETYEGWYSTYIYGSVTVRRTGPWKVIGYSEGVNACRTDDPVSVPLPGPPIGFLGELWSRARWLIYAPLIGVGLILLVLLLPLILLWSWVSDRRSDGEWTEEWVEEE